VGAAGRSGTVTVVLADRTEMAKRSDLSLDEMFERLEEAFPEGFKVEIVEGGVFVSPQRRTHWDIIRRVCRQLEDYFGEDAVILSDVRIDFPGYLNGFCPDVAKIADDAQPDDGDRFSPEDIELVVEIISRSTGRNDYGPKKAMYAVTGVPLYIIVDPYTGKCHAFSGPEGNTYENEQTVKFGDSLDLKPLGLDLVLSTEKFPRD
jgi:Uma2 family endonuclease